MARKEVDEKLDDAPCRTLFSANSAPWWTPSPRRNGFDLVLAYPDASTPEEFNSTAYLEMKLRTPAAMPFYVSPSIDITSVVIQDAQQELSRLPARIPGDCAGHAGRR